jgi:palmitoyl-protein thioesterase
MSGRSVERLFLLTGDSCCNPLSLGFIAKLLEQTLPGVYVRSVRIGDNAAEDTANGFFKNVNDQVDMVCETVRRDARLQNG